jgi:hypothetical protein|tara:strand:+ start:399 stop:692 length:294 start_codon:yes stop_codon:yes gene_type:complete
MVRLTWLDARDAETGWKSFEDIQKAHLATCQEVGWMVVNNDEKVVIMRSWCIDKDDNHGGGEVAIPKSWVSEIEYLAVNYKQVLKKRACSCTTKQSY